MDHTEARHPISYVSRRTGLSTHVVRVWERRYGAISPARSETKRRMYSDADIERLKLLRTLSSNGHTISRIAGLSDDDLKKLLRDVSEPEVPAMTAASKGAAANPANTAAVMEECRDAVQKLEWEALDASLTRARMGMSEHAVLEDVVGPLMEWVGERWHDGSVRVAQEHLATTTVKGFLARMRQKHKAAPNAPVIAVGTLAGQLHEIGSLLVATLAGVEGWREYYFGANIPASDLAAAAIQSGARIVAVSIATPGDDPLVLAELEELRQLLPDSVEILCGGGGAHRHQEYLKEQRIRYVATLSDLRTLLKAARV